MAAPTISEIADQSLIVDEALAALDFTVDDDATPLGDLTVTATSDNQDVVADADITLGGADGDRTIELTPVEGAEGSATITVEVDDGTETATTTFVVTVAARVAVDPFASRRGEPDVANDAAVPAKHDQNDLPIVGRVYVGGLGNVKVTTAAGSDVTFTAAPAGSFLPVRVRRVWDTGTTATNLVVVY